MRTDVGPPFTRSVTQNISRRNLGVATVNNTIHLEMPVRISTHVVNHVLRPVREDTLAIVVFGSESFQVLANVSIGLLLRQSPLQVQTRMRMGSLLFSSHEKVLWKYSF